VTIATVNTTTGPPAGATPGPLPRDWLKLLERARLHGPTLEPGRRERLRRRANAAGLEAQTWAEFEEDAGRRAEWEALLRRANDLEDGRHARAAIVAALVDRGGGAEALEAAIAGDPDLAAAWPGVTLLQVAERDALEAARLRLAERGGWFDALLAEAREQHQVEPLKEARAAWCRQQAASLLGRALGGDVQGLFNLASHAPGFSRELAIDLAGPLPALCAYLADLEDFPDD
jgi:hypothetical protein